MLEVTATAEKKTLQDFEVPAADGGTIHVISAGAGPTLLFAHGFLLDTSMWRPVLDHLVQQGYRVVAFDQRGHGRSRAGSAGITKDAAIEDYRSVLDHVGAEGTTLVGHSMGGFLGLLFVAKYPEHMRRLRRLVLVGANAGGVAEGSPANRLQMPLVESGVLPRLWRMPRLGRGLMKPLFGRDPKPEWLELTRQMLISQNVAGTLPLMRAMSLENHYDKLGQISVETRVLCGELDRTCPAWHSQRLGKDIQSATYRLLPGAGHMLGFEAPDAIISAITER